MRKIKVPVKQECICFCHDGDCICGSSSGEATTVVGATGLRGTLGGPTSGTLAGPLRTNAPDVVAESDDSEENREGHRRMTVSRTASPLPADETGATQAINIQDTRGRCGQPKHLRGEAQGEKGAAERLRMQRVAMGNEQDPSYASELGI